MTFWFLQLEDLTFERVTKKHPEKVTKNCQDDNVALFFVAVFFGLTASFFVC